jgi:hypothetical protein
LAELSASLALKLIVTVFGALISPLAGETIDAVAKVGGVVSVVAGIVDVGLEGVVVVPPPLPPPQADSIRAVNSANVDSFALAFSCT